MNAGRSGSLTILLLIASVVVVATSYQNLVGVNANSTSITGTLATAYPEGHPASYYVLDSQGPIELIPVSNSNGLYRYEGATITAVGDLVTQNNTRVLYMTSWAPQRQRETPLAVTGPQSTLMVLVEFNNLPHSHQSSYFQDLLTGSTNSMNSYYAEVSYGLVSVTGSTAGWYALPHPSTYYNVNTWGSCGVSGDFDKLTKDIIALVDPYVNFAAYSHFIFVTSDNYVWGCRWVGNYQTSEGVIHGVAYVTEGDPLSTYCHEFGHDLGMPDLYDYSFTDPYAFIDGWDEMSYDNAQHFSSWSKTYMGWLSPTSIVTFSGNQLTATIDRIEYTTTGKKLISKDGSTASRNQTLSPKLTARQDYIFSNYNDDATVRPHSLA